MTDNTSETTFSPMNFMHCERGIGRPKKRRFGAPSILRTLTPTMMKEKQRRRGGEDQKDQGTNRKMNLLPRKEKPKNP
jgi:hypothetical protein